MRGRVEHVPALWLPTMLTFDSDSGKASRPTAIAILAPAEDPRVRERIEQCGVPVTVCIADDFTALENQRFELIVADPASPGWSGATSITRLGALPGSPSVVVLIGCVGEEVAADYIKAGAADCVRRDRLERLAPAIHRALEARGDSSHPPASFTGVARILERITDGFFALDREWHFTYLNGKAEQILGRKREDLLGKELWLEFPDLDGSPIEHHFVKAALSQTPLEFEAHGGAWQLWAEFHVYPSGEGLSVYFQDITARKHLEEQLRHSQRLEAMGLLAGGVAHDFNNLLTVIGGYGQMTLDCLPAGQPTRRNVEAIVEAAERASVLTHQLLAFSRRQVVQTRVFDVNRLVLRMDRMMRRLIGEDIEVAMSLGEDLGRVKADPGQIEQVIMNLLVNARDAMPKGGRVSITTQDAAADPADSPEGLQAGRYVVLSISDTGTGIAPELRSRIFEPFFTTKEKGRGTGLGLSTVYGIVKQSGGDITVESELGHGSVFRIYLPRVEERAASRAGVAPERGAAKGSETILLVEDEVELRKMARHMLVRQGYRVLEAGSANEGMRVWRRHRHVQLLITDVIMPQMSGWQLAKKLRELSPGLKVLYMSGYTPDVIARHGVGGDVPFLPKPFTQDEIGRKVRALLDAEQASAATAG